MKYKCVEESGDEVQRLKGAEAPKSENLKLRSSSNVVGGVALAMNH